VYFKGEEPNKGKGRERERKELMREGMATDLPVFIPFCFAAHTRALTNKQEALSRSCRVQVCLGPSQNYKTVLLTASSDSSCAPDRPGETAHSR
jgi:hypothetical protein